MDAVVAIIVAAATIVAGTVVEERHGGRHGTASNAVAGAVGVKVQRVARETARCLRCALHCCNRDCLLACPLLRAHRRLLSVDRAASLLLQAGAATELYHAAGCLHRHHRPTLQSRLQCSLSGGSLSTLTCGLA